MTDSKLSPCPKSPNCVSTQSTEIRSKIEPIYYETSRGEAINKIIDVINSIKRSKIITRDYDYIHVEFRTRTFKFVDDVEFYFNAEEKMIHFRSASRIGYGDFGVNRRRMEDTRRRFLSL